jgi:hypothetical protein
MEVFLQVAVDDVSLVNLLGFCNTDPHEAQVGVASLTALGASAHGTNNKELRDNTRQVNSMLFLYSLFIKFFNRNFFKVCIFND